MMLFGLNRFQSTDTESIYSQSFAVALLSNGLTCTGLVYYFFLMFRGYAVLPFIAKPQRLLMYVPFAIIALTVMTVLKVNSWNVLLKYTII